MTSALRVGALALGLLLPAAAAASTARFALVVGSNRSESSSTASLKYADDDAIGMHELLTEAGVRSLLLVTPDENTKRLHPDLAPEGPSRVELLFEAFGALRMLMQQEKSRGNTVEFLFFFSGHGDVQNGEGYAVLDEGRLTRAQLHDRILARSPADRNHVIVDSCKSAFLAYGKGAGGKRVPFPQPFAGRGQGLANTGFILSTSTGGDSHEWERLQAGVFSYEIRSALRGSADADGDGTITYAELGAFLTSANSKIANAGHRPDFLVIPPGRSSSGLDFPLLSWNGDGFAVDQDLGHAYVERANGERVLDVHSQRSQLALLRLPSDRPLFLRSGDGSTERAIVAPEARRASELPSTPASTASKGALHIAFESLFAEPFAAASVEEYRRGYSAPEEDRRDSSPGTVTAVEATSEKGWRATARAITAWTALGAGTFGGVALLAGLGQHLGAGSVPQVELARRNQQIETMNGAARIAAGVAGLSGLAWLALRLSEPASGVAWSALPMPGGAFGAISFAH